MLLVYPANSLKSVLTTCHGVEACLMESAATLLCSFTPLICRCHRSSFCCLCFRCAFGRALLRVGISR